MLKTDEIYVVETRKNIVEKNIKLFLGYVHFLTLFRNLEYLNKFRVKFDDRYVDGWLDMWNG